MKILDRPGKTLICDFIFLALIIRALFLPTYRAVLSSLGLILFLLLYFFVSAVASGQCLVSLGRREKSLLVWEFIAFAFLFWMAGFPSMIAGPIIFLVGPFILLFFIYALGVSVHLAFAAWKGHRVRSLLPLAVSLTFAWMTLFIPGVVLPRRDVPFFEKHASEYQTCIAAFERDNPNPDDGGDYALPIKYKSLSDDGQIRVYTHDGNVNYYFLYVKGFQEANGVLYAPEGLIGNGEDCTPLTGHSGWYFED